ncbi:hypothetical protein OnM2_083012 [Erysiphe neolycopersici]|uniref:DUF8035 domain-containing protein n=1 Tax=Erysiphe neolycopersici TaxID=212602 RepID=A0A420HFN8_9PEZI|nr:hypothetical protein OnM2_083012 [Erysiphe neolycopersici]
MARGHHHSSSQTYPQRWDAEHFSQDQECNHHNIRAEKPLPFRRSISQVRVHQRSVNEEKHRELPLPVQDRSHYRRRQTINAQQPYLARDNFTPKDYENRQNFYSPPSPRREIPVQPTALRRQSSLDTLDRKPRALNGNRQHYISPTRHRSSLLPGSLPIPPPPRHMPPSEQYNNEYYHNPEGANQNPTGGQSPRKYFEYDHERDYSTHRGRGTSKEIDENHIPNDYLRNSSTDSSWSRDSDSPQSEFPKRGKTKIPGKLVHKHAIVDLGYPFEEEGNLIIILKALGRKNIDELIKLSEKYKADEKVEIEATSKELTNVYTVAYPSQPNSLAIDYPPIPPLPPVAMPISPPAEVLTTTYVPVPSASNGAATVTLHNPVGGVPRTSDVTKNFAQAPLIKDERAISAEIKALEAEKEALLAHGRADQLRREGQGIVVLREERERDGYREEVTVIRREGKIQTREEKSSSSNRRPRIVKDRKGRKSIAVPRNFR